MCMPYWVSVNLDSNVGSASDAATRAAVPAGHSSLPPPPLGRGLLIVIGALFVATMLGVSFALTLAVYSPLLLIALAPLARHIILVAPYTELQWLVPIAALRGTLTCAVAFEVGRVYGPQGIRLFERRSPRLGRWLRMFERAYGAAAPLFLLVMPGPLTSTLAAVSGTSRWLTLVPSALGLSAWAWIHYTIGDWLAPYTAQLMDFVKHHLLETTLACVALVLTYQWIARKRRLEKVR